MIPIRFEVMQHPLNCATKFASCYLAKSFLNTNKTDSEVLISQDHCKYFLGSSHTKIPCVTHSQQVELVLPPVVWEYTECLQKFGLGKLLEFEIEGCDWFRL